MYLYAKHPFVCLSMSEWGDVPHNSRHLMRVAQGRGHRVLYVETIGLRAPRLDRRDALKILRRLRRLARPLRRVERGFWVLSPVAVPGAPRLTAALMRAQVLGAARALAPERRRRRALRRRAPERRPRRRAEARPADDGDARVVARAGRPRGG